MTKTSTLERRTGKSGLHNEYVFGPVMSRRLGVSLGINVLPKFRKICNFECPYCELGFTDTSVKEKLPAVTDVIKELREHLQHYKSEGYAIDAITFAGNGEPTLHPKFEQLVDETIKLRDELAPEASIAVLTNATKIDDESIYRALLKVDERQVKLDAGTEEVFQLVDLPAAGITLDSIVKGISKFHGDMTIQTMFVRGSYDSRAVDNTTPKEVDAWLKLLDKLRPNKIQIYSLDRAPAAPTLKKVPREDLEAIATRVRELGLNVQVF
ncbi:MAG TPA: radical SAM protein [Blastocatellia bacterium]|nr:radical SAM protein [Blastocatellia bacterium]